MSGCSIDKNSQELLKERKKTLALLGIDDETKLKSFLSMFLNKDMYAMYLQKEQSKLDEESSSSTVNNIIANNVDIDEVIEIDNSINTVNEYSYELLLLQLNDETSKLVFDDMKESIEVINNTETAIEQLKQKAKESKVNFDDYNLSGKSYRELKRILEKEKSKLKTYSNSIEFYFNNRNEDDTFDLFMSTRTKDGYIIVSKNGKQKNVYNKFAKYFKISKDQREFYSVKDLPSYLTSGNKIIFDKNTDLLTIDDLDTISKVKGDSTSKNALANKLASKNIPEVVAKTVLSVLKAKGVSFQKRHFGNDYAKINLENYESYLTGSDKEKKQIAIDVLNGLDFARTIITANSIDFNFPDTYKSMINFDYLSNNEGVTDFRVTDVKLDSNGIPTVSRTKYTGTEKGIDYAAKNKELTENSYISLLSLIPGSETAKGIKANLDAMSTISDDVKNAVKVHSIAVLEDVIKMSNLSSNDEQFEDVWGIEKGSFDGDLRDVENLGREGYLPRSVIVQKLGSAIYNDIGFKFNNNVSSIVSEGIKTELGLFAIEVMNRSGLLDNNENNLKLINVGSSENEKIQALIKINKESKFSEDDSGNQVAKNDKLYIEDLQNMSTLMNHLYSFDDKKKPMFNKPKARFDRTVRNGFQKVSEDTNRILNDYESTGHKFNPIAKDVYNLWKTRKQLAYDFVGIGTLDEVGSKGNYNGNRHNIEDAIAQASKFNNERLELDTLMEFYEENAFDKDTGELKQDVEFYINWDFTVSGRYMVDSTINPQTGKTATRYLIQSKQMDSEMKTDSKGIFDSEQMYQFKVGLAQGFGTGADKSTDDTAFKNMENKFIIDDKGNVEFKLEKDGSMSIEHKGFLFFRAAIDSDFKGTEQEKSFVSRIQNINKFDKLLYGPDEDVNKIEEKLFNQFSKFIGKPVHSGEETHTLTAMRALAEIDMFAKNNSGSEVFNHTFTVEADDITSGMILTLMGLGTKDSREFLEKGGVYTKESQDFWNGVVNDLKTSEPEIAVGSKLNDILSSYKGYLTHGFLVEFGKLMDSSEFNKDVRDRLKSNEIYTEAVINKRIHFKDFYNTVAKESGERLDAISKNLDKSFIDEKDKEAYRNENEFNVAKIESIINSIKVSKPNATSRDKAKAVGEEISRVISSNINSELYDKLNNYVNGSKTITNSIFSESLIPKYDTNKKDYRIKDIENFISSSVNVISTKIPESNYELNLLFESFKSVNKDNKKFNPLVNVYKSFLKSKKIKYDFVKGDDIGNNFRAKEAIDIYIKNTITDKNSYDIFYRSFKKEYINNMSKYIFNDSVSKMSDTKNSYDYIRQDSFNDFAKVISNITKEVGKYNSSRFNSGEFGIDANTFDVISQFKDKVVERALINVAGNNISRNAAKSPVMVFIYGSGINTIRKAIANIVGKEAIYNSLIKKSIDGNNIRNDIFNATEFDLNNKDFSLKVLLNEMTNGRIFDDRYFKTKQFKKVNNEKGIVENQSYEEIKELLSVSDFSNMIIDEDMMEPIYKASSNTYGESFADTFKTLFETITKSREIIKVNEIVRYSIFKHKLNSSFKELALEKGLIAYKEDYTDSVQFELTQNDVNDIKKKLERDGFGHSNLDSNGARQSLDKMTAGLIGKRVTISFKDAFDANKNASTSFSGSFRTDTENTGAAPVTGIHQLDGRKIGLSLEGTGVLNIYDAFYSSSNELDKTSDKMNEKFLETVEGYNLIKTSLKEVENMILALDGSERDSLLNSIIESDLESKIIEEGMKKINAEYDIFRQDFSGDFYTLSTEALSNMLNNMFNDINSSLSDPVDVLVRHNQLSDSAKGHNGVAFNHSSEVIDSSLVFSFFQDIIEAARRSNEKSLTRFNQDGAVDIYLNSEVADKESKDRFIITRNEEAYKQNLGIIDKLIKNLNVNDESKIRFKNIIEEFKECIK